MTLQIEKYKSVTIVNKPVVSIIAAPAIQAEGLGLMREWLEAYRPTCLPKPGEEGAFSGLLPHDGSEDGRGLSDAEMLAELAGRKCYDSFGLAAGRKTNGEYLRHTQEGDVPHRSIMYHPKFTFFMAGVSRRVSHELIRNYVGADRDEEGSPSQESTRFTHHPGFFVIPPKMADSEEDRQYFGECMHEAYQAYLTFVQGSIAEYAIARGDTPKGMDRKRIYEAAAALLPGAAATSFVWTTNPVALAKLIQERVHEAADLEFNQFGEIWRDVAVNHAPNLYPQPWMQKAVRR